MHTWPAAPVQRLGALHARSGPAAKLHRQHLRDAPFAEARFAQRVAQALGRCNRSEHDRAVYLLTDPEFLTRFSQRRVLDALPPDVSGDVYAALERADHGIRRGLEEAGRFLAGGDYQAESAPPRRAAEAPPPTAASEVNGFLALWHEDYSRAAATFDRVAQALSQTKEHRAFWLAMRALALHLAARYGDAGAAAEVPRRVAGRGNRRRAEHVFHPAPPRRSPAGRPGDRRTRGRP